MTDLDTMTDYQTTTLQGRFTFYKTKIIRGRQSTQAAFDSDAGTVFCIWHDSEDFYLSETEEYRVVGIVKRHGNKLVMLQPSIEVVEAQPLPAFTPAGSSPWESFKDGFKAVALTIFWVGIIGFGLFSASSSSSQSNDNDTGSSDSSYSSGLDESEPDEYEEYSSEPDYDDSSYDSYDSYEEDSEEEDEYYYSSDSDYDYDGYTNTAGDYVPSPSYSDGSSIGGYNPSAICGDGTYSYSQSRSGTCSHHGGVSSWY